eukprot:NODE_409_length_1031_cov_5378.673116_g262_i0.p5 GENE.NODE_409_length_1031_cov_5378.673116_g262_i0~~NODE_409_length_1031_cov_5378.673116_g262_i0.p5  ORF type:complete len:50 (-),score=5.03 NODE_409_length_1031_cov_5378.673116_g262_i0:231-380(-)
MALKRVLKQLQDPDPSVDSLDFSEFDNRCYYDDVSCRIIAVAIKDNEMT